MRRRRSVPQIGPCPGQPANDLERRKHQEQRDDALPVEPAGTLPATHNTANSAPWAQTNAPAPASATRPAKACCAVRSEASRAWTVASIRPSAPNARTSRQPVMVSRTAMRSCPSRLPAAGLSAADAKAAQGRTKAARMKSTPITAARVSETQP